MRAKTIVFSLLFSLFMGSHAMARSIAGVALPDSMVSGDTTLALNGAGIRKKFFIKVYVGSLYLPAPSHDANAIIKDDKPMAIRLDITSGMVSADKMEKAIIEGFDNATGDNTSPIKEEIDAFLQVFQQGVSKGDVFEMQYLPGEGTIILKSGKQLKTIPSLAFKQALFGIWLSNRPAQESLKQAMLGQ